MRRDLVVAAAALVLGLVGLGVGVAFVWSYLVAPLRGPYAVEWQAVELDPRGRAITVTYQDPCGSTYSHTDTEVESGRLVVTVHVEGRGIYCSADESVIGVTVRLDERVDPDIPVVDGS